MEFRLLNETQLKTLDNSIQKYNEQDVNELSALCNHVQSMIYAMYIFHFYKDEVPKSNDDNFDIGLDCILQMLLTPIGRFLSDSAVTWQKKQANGKSEQEPDGE